METTGPLGPLFWLRLIVAGVWMALPLASGLVLTWWTTRKRNRRARVARLTGLGAGAVIGVALAWAAQLWLAPIAVVAGYLVGAFTSEVRESPAPAGEVRVASLRPRTVREYVPRWAMIAAVAVAGVTVSGPVVLSGVPTASYGPWHPIDGVTLPGATLHWAPLRDWLPLAVVAGGALLVGVYLVRRVLGLPADPSDPGESARRTAVRTIIGTVLGVELLALGALTVFSSAGLAVPADVGGAAYVGSRILVWTGLTIAVAGVVMWWALSIRGRRPLAPDPVPQT